MPGEPVPQLLQRKPSAVARPQCCLWPGPAQHTQLALSMGKASEEGAVAGRAGQQGPCPGISSLRAPQWGSQTCSSVRDWTEIGDSGQSPPPSLHFNHFVTAKSVCSQIPPLRNSSAQVSTLSAEERQYTVLWLAQGHWPSAAAHAAPKGSRNSQRALVRLHHQKGSQFAGENQL